MATKKLKIIYRMKVILLLRYCGLGCSVCQVSVLQFNGLLQIAFLLHGVSYF